MAAWLILMGRATHVPADGFNAQSLVGPPTCAGRAAGGAGAVAADFRVNGFNQVPTEGFVAHSTRAASLSFTVGAGLGADE